MLRGFYTAVSGMIAEQRRHDAITHNIANLNTPGYKTRSVPTRAFPNMLIELMNGSGVRPDPSIGSMASGVLAEESVANYQEGDVRQTKSPSDFALSTNVQLKGLTFDAAGRAVGPKGQTVYQPLGFFTLKDSNGNLRYTRAGNFTVDSQGRLLAANGWQVIGQNGQPIVLNRAMETVRVGQDGRFFDASTGQPLLDLNGQTRGLYIAQINNPNNLVPNADATYSLKQGAGQAAGALPPAVAYGQAIVKQGYLEQSNVNPATSMVDLMTTLRAYEANQKVIQYYDRSMDKTVNDVGKV